MKQIIKAIWKSNEVPTNEYFLWLQYRPEKEGFVLYVRGQSGWEPLVSEAQLSDVYTKEEIDTILANYYNKSQSDDLYLPLTAGETKPLTGPLYCQDIMATSPANSTIGSVSGNKFYFLGKFISYGDANYLDFVRTSAFVGDDNNGGIDITMYNVTGMMMEVNIAAGECYKFMIRKTNNMSDFGIPQMSYSQLSGSPLSVNLGMVSGDSKMHIVIGDGNLVLPEYCVINARVTCANTGNNSKTIYNSVTFSNNKQSSDYTTFEALLDENA